MPAEQRDLRGHHRIHALSGQVESVAGEIVGPIERTLLVSEATEVADHQGHAAHVVESGEPLERLVEAALGLGEVAGAAVGDAPERHRRRLAAVVAQLLGQLGALDEALGSPGRVPLERGRGTPHQQRGVEAFSVAELTGAL